MYRAGAGLCTFFSHLFPNPMQYVIDIFTKKYAQFTGRARRAEFWSFYLAIFIGIFVIGGVGAVIKAPWLVGIVYLGVLVPYFGVAVRRMHDVGKSGWFFLIPLYNIILCFTEGQHGENEYGPDPKGGVVAQF